MKRENLTEKFKKLEELKKDLENELVKNAGNYEQSQKILDKILNVELSEIALQFKL